MHNVKGFLKTREDSMILVHALRLKILKHNTKRLSIDERSNIKPGDIFCYVKGSDELRRWTDGLPWSGSRISGHFLVYEATISRSNYDYNQDGHTKSLNFNSLRIFPNLRNNRFPAKILKKRTISIEYNNKTYHFINYYNDFMDLNVGISESDFFISLKNALNKKKELLHDDYINSCKNIHHLLFEDLKALPFIKNNLKSTDQKRKESEKEAIMGLWMFSNASLRKNFE